MKELSIFIDESGDFGAYDAKAPFYIISMVIHEQDHNIRLQVDNLNKALLETELTRNFVHVGPLIRREYEYKHLDVIARLRILRRLIKFTEKVDFSYKTFVVHKKHIKNDIELIEKLVHQLSNFIRAHYPYFLSFDTIKIYYDNGQAGVMRTIVTVFTTLFKNVEFKKVLQKDYKMLQVADLVCTTTLTEIKMRYKILSKSEHRVLGTEKEIRKNLLKPIKRKEFKD